MLTGYHLIFGAYGFWLPNDPRGSWSDFVGSWNLFRAGGRATKTTEFRSLAHCEHDQSLRLSAKTALKRPPVHFTGLQARAVGQGFANYVKNSGLKVWACAILPDHVHLVVGAKMKAKQLVIQLKGAATESLNEQGLHPFAHVVDRQGRSPKCFARGEWKVFLELDDLPHAVQYVEDNPVKEGKKPQRWSFVVPYV